MSKYEITQKEYEAVIGANPSRFKGPDLPVETVTWYEAIEYCNRRSIKEGLTPAYQGSGGSVVCDFQANGYRLPTEAEWEYAAAEGNKAGLTYEYRESNSVEAVGWYNENSENSTHAVGTKQPNSLGLYDMSGNVWEWCWDWYGGYSSDSQTDPRGPASGSRRVLRGGSWHSNAQDLRSANRLNYGPLSRSSYLGFRVVRT
jgi:formylglycine-generating enzyme required for sulfatase activity